MEPMGALDANRLQRQQGRLDFETLISDLSARFVQLRAEDVDRGIEDALALILAFFDVDRCGVIRVQIGQEFAYLSHAAYADGAERVSPEWNLASLFPWHYEQVVNRGKNASFQRLSELPSEGEIDRQTFSSMGVCSALHIPLEIAGATRHVLALNRMRGEIAWPEEYVPRLRLLGEIFVNALERRRTDLLLAESEARVRLAVASAGMGLWVLHLETGRYWVTDEIREFFGYAPEDDVTLEDVLRRVHPEDREKVQHALEEAIRAQAEGSVEYRVAGPDGSLRWLVSRGRPQRALDGATYQVMGMTLDITRRKRSEIELRDSAARMAAAADVARLGFYEAFWDERRVLLDERLRDLMGVTAEEEAHALDRWYENVHPEDLERVLEARRDLLRCGSDVVTAQYRYRHPTRGQRWFQHSVRALDSDAQGQVVR
ncbi:MAG: PAS domain-containing protein, partial [Proteobacteria bacterium]|nr:PAS domain-containing protein [Pseudomonadota bacterium]